MKLLGVFLILLSAFSFGLMPIFAVFAYKSGLTTETLLLFRFLIAAVVIHLYLLIKHIPYPRGKQLALLIFMGAVLYAAQAFSYFTAVRLIGSSLTSILLYLYPGIVLVLSYVFLHSPIRRSDLIALGLINVGIVLVVGIEFGTIHWGGIGLGVMAALIYSAYIIVGTHAMRRCDPVMASGVIIGSAAMVYAIYGISLGTVLPDTPEQWGWVGMIALVSTVIAILAFFAGLKRIGPMQASMISTVELVVTLFFSYLFFDEMMTLGQMAGAFLILIAAIKLARK